MGRAAQLTPLTCAVAWDLSERKFFFVPQLDSYVVMASLMPGGAPRDHAHHLAANAAFPAPNHCSSEKFAAPLHQIDNCFRLDLLSVCPLTILHALLSIYRHLSKVNMQGGLAMRPAHRMGSSCLVDL